MIALSRVLVRGVLAVGALCMPLPAPAQTTYVSTDAEGWTFQPAVLTSSVPGHLAWPEAGTTTGSNMQVMWYRRESTGSWTSWGWTDNDVGAAALWVLGNVGDDTAFDQSHEIMAAIGGRTAADAVAPKQVVNGLFFDDPLQPEVQSSAHPEVLVSNLAELGWEAAPGLSSLAVSEQQCQGQQLKNLDLLLNDLTRTAEIALFGTSAVTAACAWPCTCTTMWGPFVPDPPGTWTFVSQQWSGGFWWCVYQRPATRAWRSVGRFKWTCLNCAGSGTRAVIQSRGTRTTALPCVPPPP